MLWAVFTLIAAAAQTARNAMQRELTATLGTVGATHVRFLFGFPFALIFLAGLMAVTGDHLPRGAARVLAVGDRARRWRQIAATTLMLAAMGERSFVVAYAYIKTEPMQVALFGLIFLGDKLTPVIGCGNPDRDRRRDRDFVQAAYGTQSRHAVNLDQGIGGGTMFALSAIGYRGAILSLGIPDFVMAATFTVAIGLVIQATILSAYLALRDPEVMRDIARAWRPSLFAGFIGAFASEFWFLAFAIATAANVRTLALVEVLFAQGVTRFVFRQPTTQREAIGIVLVVIGVALLVWAY